MDVYAKLDCYHDRSKEAKGELPNAVRCGYDYDAVTKNVVIICSDKTLCHLSGKLSEYT